MPAKNPRINITLEETLISMLTALAEQEHQSISSVAKELILEALERREDVALSAIATLRDVPKAKRIKHDEAWK